MKPFAPADLRRIEILADAPEDLLRWIAERGRLRDLEDGEALIASGDAARDMVLLLEGEVEVLRPVGGRLVPFFRQHAGVATGLLPFSRMKTYTSTVRACGPTRLLQVDRSHFDELLRLAPQLGARFAALIADRVRDTTQIADQHEKMLALGKLSAGLAHELNNPAAAVRRSADVLRERLDRLPRVAADAMATGAGAEAFARATGRLAAWRRHGPPAPLATLERSAREDAVADWLEARGVPEPWVLAETFAEAGLQPPDLEELTDGLPPGADAAIVAWAEAVIAATGIAAEIGAAAARISELVAAVKSYSHMDRQADAESVDVRAGLDSTLVMLGHALKVKSIALEREYDPALPEVPGWPAELNQVWTNLIDNAIDAMPPGGTLRIQAVPEGSSVVVRVIDNGAGIPEALQSRIFEPFFTTKAMGEGTGLGLEVVHRVVTRQHGGRVEVESAPGRTVFAVRLPRAMAEPAPRQTAV